MPDTSQPKVVSRKRLTLAANALLTVGLLALLTLQIDVSRLADMLVAPATLRAIMFATAALTLQLGIGVMRQIELVRIFGQNLALRRSFAISVRCLLVSQIFLNSVAGEISRAIQFAGEGMTIRNATLAVLFDRVIGLVVLLTLVIAATAILLTVTTDSVMQFSLLILCAASAAGILGLFTSGFLRQIAARLPWRVLRYTGVEILLDLVSVARFVALEPMRAFVLGVFSLVMHTLSVLSIIVIACLVGVTASPWLIGLVVIPVILLAMLPISLAGWGIREAAMVTGLGFLGTPADLALTVSLSFGISMLLTSLLGLPTLFYWRSSNPRLLRSKD